MAWVLGMRPSSRVATWFVGAVAAVCVIGLNVGVASAATKTYSTPGTYTFDVPSGVTHITVTAVGAAGGACAGGSGGEGASVSATVPVSPREKLVVGVAGVGGEGCVTTSPGTGGTTGGAAGGAGLDGPGGAGGGGASLVGPTAWPGAQKPLVIAGGGGGASYQTNGGNAGSSGTDGTATGSGGAAGGQKSGGTGGVAGSTSASRGSKGSAGGGGAGGAGDTTSSSSGGGGGGGGYYGGGGGGGSAPGGDGGGGGGGSSFTASGATAVSGPTLTTASAMVSITYTSIAPPAKFSCTGAEQTYSVPAGVRALKVKAIGAAGGSSSAFGSFPAGSGGQGAVVGAWVRLPRATSTVYVEVGCAGSIGVGGFNGGGGGSGANGGGGGGASDVRLDPMSTPLTTSDTRLVVAGGGGGGGVCSPAGGAAGDSSVTGAGKGGNGSDPCPGSTAGRNGGFGGTAGGKGGTNSPDESSCTSFAGSLGQGGAIDTACSAGNFAGAGGGGYYGGGGAGNGLDAGGSGGAGSSFWVTGATHHSMAMNTTSLAPEVVITPACLVPNLKGKTLATAKTALTNAQCALGTVTKKKSTGKAGIVLSQKPKKGTILTLGSKVAVVVSKT